MAEDREPRSPATERPQGGDSRSNDNAGTPGSGKRDSESGGSQPDVDGKRGSENASASAAKEQSWGNLYQHFHGNVYASQGVFGIGGVAPPEPRAYGRMEEAEIAKIVQAYAEPVCYAEASEALKTERVVILTGAAGSGRRAGAVTMLEWVRSPGQPLVGLSPATTLEQLAERSFDEGTGYLIGDMFDADLVPELVDYYWGNVCRKVRQSKAHLVVTTGTGSRIAKSTAVKHFSWQRPEVADVLRAHLGAAVVDDEVIDLAAEALGPNYPLSEMSDTARRLATSNPDHLHEFLAGLQENDRLAVVSWLEEVDAAIPAVLEIAALAFLVGLPERVFEAELRELKGRIAEFAPEWNAASDKARDEIDLRFRQLRKGRSEHPLLTVRFEPVARGSGSLVIRHVDFSVPTYRMHVIAELWSRLDADFWAGMQRWLHDIAADGDPDLITTTAIGLAMLALEAPDEVIDAYLERWTAEEATWNEQMMAVYVVWRMSMFGQLAPVALQIAMHWATQGSRTQRRVATYAFSGELGARFPVDAVWRLTQLAEQGEPLAAKAHALLFATLAEQSSDAAVVLREMRRRMNLKQDKPAEDRVLDTIADLLSIRDPRSGRPSIALFLMANPDKTGDVGRLWAQTLYKRPWRERAIAALRNAIGAIERGQRNPYDLVRALGSAVGQELPPGEREFVRSDLLNYDDDARRRDGTKQNAADDQDGQARPQVSRELLETFLNACANPSPERSGSMP
jgi:hypothetical protein